MGEYCGWNTSLSLPCAVVWKDAAASNSVLRSASSHAHTHDRSPSRGPETWRLDSAMRSGCIHPSVSPFNCQSAISIHLAVAGRASAGWCLTYNEALLISLGVREYVSLASQQANRMIRDHSPAGRYCFHSYIEIIAMVCCYPMLLSKLCIG